MSRAGMVIGLGGIGVQVVHRIRSVLETGPDGKVPENLRLLAFDILHPSTTTGRLGAPYYFLVRLPQGETHPAGERQSARQALLTDLEKGAPSSLTLRSLTLNIEALRRSGASAVDIFIVASSFGSTGTAWLLDMAYLCKHTVKNQPGVGVHAVLITPEACQTSLPLTTTHQRTHAAVLQELHTLLQPRDWSQGIQLYEQGHLAGLPGLLNAAPFSSIQIVDAYPMGGSLNSAAVPAAADGILCQLDEQASTILRRAATRPEGFSSFGIQTLFHPARLLTASEVQRAILELVEDLFPLRFNPETGRPTGLEPGRVLVPSDPYGDIERWLGPLQASGVLADVMYQVGLTPAMRQDWLQRLAGREIADWKRVLFSVENSAQVIPENGIPETTIPFVQRHVRAYLTALGNKALELASNQAGVVEYLARIEQTLTDYIADVGRAEEMLKRKGEHSEAEAVRRAVEESFQDWDSKRTSNWSRLFPARIEAAQERYIAAKQASVNFQQREALMRGARKSASLMLTLTRKLIEFYHYYAGVLALANESVYNTAHEQFQHIERLLQQERAIRSQKVVVDEMYERRQTQAVQSRLLERLTTALCQTLLGIETHIDWHADALQVHAALETAEGTLDLGNLSRDREETAATLTAWLNRALNEQISEGSAANTILNFISYINPRADRLGTEMAERSGPLAHTLVPPTAQVSLLFSPDPDAANRMIYVRELVYEFYHQVGELYQLDNGDSDRLILFRRYDGLSLDNLMTYHQHSPSPGDRSTLKPYTLWDF